jgi:peptide-N4-(N-acetyl-beta-glucosaminyl)asparagine amidase
LAWRLARGETDAAPKCMEPYVWKLTQSELKAGKMNIQYSTSRNKYVRGVGREEIDGWENGTFRVKSVFRKEEKDWKMTYLARTGKTILFLFIFQYIWVFILMNVKLKM